MIGSAPRSHITGVPGWETPNEQAYLLQLAKQVVPGGCIVEIGAEYGMSASLFIYGAQPTVQIYSIDLFPGYLLDQHKGNLRIAGLEGRSVQIKGDSTDISLVWDRGLIDLLFIDGDHSYNGVKADIVNWIPRVKPSGIVAFHDCACGTNPNPHPLHYDVSKAIEEWQNTPSDSVWVTLPSVDSILSYKRIK